MAIHQDLQAAQAEIARLTAALTAALSLKLSVKISEKGAVSVYGLNQRFPTTLYAEQWERLVKFMPDVLSCIAAGDKAGTISRKAVS
jgi:hypothetical protein